MLKLKLPSLVLALAAAYGPCALAENGIGAGQILIGQSASLSGTTAETGQQLRDGANAYFEMVNRKGGINGRKIKVLTLDDAGNTKKGEENTQKLIEQDKVFLLFGYTGRNSTEVTEAVDILSKLSLDAVITNAAVKPLSQFVKQMRQKGAGGQFLSVSFVGTPVVKELGADSAGLIMAQVVPLPTRKSIPIVAEYQATLAAVGAKPDYSFNSLEGYITAKVLVEALKRAGKDVTRAKFIKAVESIDEWDLGGYFVGYSPTSHNGSKYVDITIINKEGRFFN